MVLGCLSPKWGIDARWVIFVTVTKRLSALVEVCGIRPTVSATVPVFFVGDKQPLSASRFDAYPKTSHHMGQCGVALRAACESPLICTTEQRPATKPLKKMAFEIPL
jgi:hypothetical protein